MTDRKRFQDFCVPSVHPPTENELAWIEFLRLMFGDSDPPPTLRLVQRVRRLIAHEPKGLPREHAQFSTECRGLGQLQVFAT